MFYFSNYINDFIEVYMRFIVKVFVYKYVEIINGVCILKVYKIFLLVVNMFIFGVLRNWYFVSQKYNMVGF